MGRVVDHTRGAEHQVQYLWNGAGDQPRSLPLQSVDRDPYFVGIMTAPSCHIGHAAQSREGNLFQGRDVGAGIPWPFRRNSPERWELTAITRGSARQQGYGRGLFMFPKMSSLVNFSEEPGPNLGTYLEQLCIFQTIGVSRLSAGISLRAPMLGHIVLEWGSCQAISGLVCSWS